MAPVRPHFLLCVGGWLSTSMSAPVLWLKDVFAEIWYAVLLRMRTSMGVFVVQVLATG